MPAAVKPTKNQMRRAKKKAAKKHEAISTPNTVPTSESEAETEPAKEDGTMAELDPMDTLEELDPLYEMYKDIMEKFEQGDKEDPALKEPEKPEIYFDDDDEIPDEDEEKGVPKLSKKARKEQNKLSVAELKALVKKPETVDWTDTSASDPRLLVHIKAYRNVVPVPAHWSLKREYLSSKRGVEKPPFALPKFIQETGIAEMRDAVLEKQDQASLKQKQRERVQPKMGKLDIDYQKLYEAFFRFQTKPELTRYGEVYYEGKEYETNLRHLRPGELSEELKEALNIPPGAPPPWLINQQRFGPPPSYPALKIPGLNAPPPPGAIWGFHPGGYGKPPVDEYNRPLYGGDIFGVLQPQQNTQMGEPVEKTLWGELQEPEEESEEEESDDEEEDDDKEDIGAGLQTPSGLETPGGIASTVPSEFGGAESVAGEFNLRKQRRGTETEESTHPRSAYQVVPEQQARVQGFFGGDRTYDLKAAQSSLPVLGQEDQNRKRKKPGDIDVAVDPDSLQAKDGMDKEELKKMYEAQKQQEQGQWGVQEDLSEMIASESRKRQKRDEERRAKRYDDRDRQLGGETYRPSQRPGRSPPPRTDNFRSNRSPPRRARSPPPVDTYIPPGSRVAGRSRSRSPGTYRRRSRSPTFRPRDNPGSFRGRPRSPARRFSPRREERPRSPIRRRSRSPYGDRDAPPSRGGRARSPPLKRGREVSPIEDRRYRSPPPNKRERLASPPRTRYERRQSPPPRRAYSPPRDPRRTPPAGPRVSNRQRSRTPPRREERIDPYAVASWRRRSLSPAPRRSEHASGRESVATSRRSSPPIHPDRLALAGPDTRSPAYENSRAAPQSYAAPSPPAYHGRSPRRERDQSPQRRGYSPAPMSPREPSRYRSPSPRRDSPPPHERDEPRNGVGHGTWSSNQMAASSGASYRNGSHYSSRAPPSGPAGGSRYNEPSGMSPPAGPASAPLSMSAHNRPSSASLLSAPTRPRGGSSFGREYPRDGSYGGPHSRRGPPMQYQYNEPPSRHYDRPPRDGIPTGPRSGHSGPAPYDSRPPFRTNNSSSTTYPRTQRFMHHVANVPAIVPGGKLLPSGLDPASERRLAQLEEDKKKLLDQIEEKQRAKRAGLRDWERLERESAREGLKSELAEGHLNRMTGEDGLGSAAF